MTVRTASAVLAVVMTLGGSVASGIEPAMVTIATPVTIENCGVSTSFDEAPRRVVTANQAATELMLALDLEEHLVGTAFLDDPILPEFADAYNSVPVLGRGYPTRDALTAADPDLIFASYSSAFTAQGLGRRTDFDVATYLSPSACPASQATEPATMEMLYREIREIGRIFRVPSRADALIASFEADLRAIQERVGAVSNAPRVFWYDAGSPPSAAACCGMPNEMLGLLGGENIFSDVPGSWTGVGWNEVIARNPDVIVLVDAPWSSAASKEARLRRDPALAGIEAVRQQRFITVEFSSSTPGIRTVAAVRRLAEALYPGKFAAEQPPQAEQ